MLGLANLSPCGRRAFPGSVAGNSVRRVAGVPGAHQRTTVTARRVVTSADSGRYAQPPIRVVRSQSGLGGGRRARARVFSTADELGVRRLAAGGSDDGVPDAEENGETEFVLRDDDDDGSHEVAPFSDGLNDPFAGLASVSSGADVIGFDAMLDDIVGGVSVGNGDGANDDDDDAGAGTGTGGVFSRPGDDQPWPASGNWAEFDTFLVKLAGMGYSLESPNAPAGWDDENAGDGGSSKMSTPEWARAVASEDEKSDESDDTSDEPGVRLPGLDDDPFAHVAHDDSSTGEDLTYSNKKRLLLEFSRDRDDAFDRLSERELYQLADHPMPHNQGNSGGRKQVNALKRLRAHLGIDDADLRGKCAAADHQQPAMGAVKLSDVLRVVHVYAEDVTPTDRPSRAMMQSLLRRLTLLADSPRQTASQTRGGGTTRRRNNRGGWSAGNATRKGPSLRTTITRRRGVSTAAGEEAGGHSAGTSLDGAVTEAAVAEGATGVAEGRSTKPAIPREKGTRLTSAWSGIRTEAAAAAQGGTRKVTGITGVGRSRLTTSFRFLSPGTGMDEGEVTLAAVSEVAGTADEADAAGPRSIATTTEERPGPSTVTPSDRTTAGTRGRRRDKGRVSKEAAIPAGLMIAGAVTRMPGVDSTGMPGVDSTGATGVASTAAEAEAEAEAAASNAAEAVAVAAGLPEKATSAGRGVRAGSAPTATAKGLTTEKNRGAPKNVSSHAAVAGTATEAAGGTATEAAVLLRAAADGGPLEGTKTVKNGVVSRVPSGEEAKDGAEEEPVSLMTTAKEVSPVLVAGAEAGEAAATAAVSTAATETASTTGKTAPSAAAGSTASSLPEEAVGREDGDEAELPRFGYGDPRTSATTGVR